MKVFLNSVKLNIKPRKMRALGLFACIFIGFASCSASYAAPSESTSTPLGEIAEPPHSVSTVVPSADHPDFYTDTSETSWVVVKMHRINSNGGRTDVELLRPIIWVTSRGVSEGDRFDFTATERHLSGVMTIDSISPVEMDLGPLRDAVGQRMVTGRFVTTKAKTYLLTIEEGITEIKATGNHPLYSISRNGWVDVAELQPGERLRTRESVVTVASVEPLEGTETVYNLEVSGAHNYFVGEEEVLAHNNCQVRALEPEGLPGRELVRPGMGDELARHVSDSNFSPDYAVVGHGRRRRLMGPRVNDIGTANGRMTPQQLADHLQLPEGCSVYFHACWSGSNGFAEDFARASRTRVRAPRYPAAFGWNPPGRMTGIDFVSRPRNMMWRIGYPRWRRWLGLGPKMGKGEFYQPANASFFRTFDYRP